ncbi:hypothetical protein PIB30_112146, partial [Stylosanthes scabra]|nr:hypothetical protein [Stylosanthes scabra]
PCLPRLGVDFHAYAWVFILALQVELFFLTPILEVPGACMMILASHAYAWDSTPMRGSCGATHGRLQHGSCVAACCQDSFHAYAWVFYAYA